MTAGKAVETALRSAVEAGGLAGAATLIWRGGHLAHTATAWRADPTDASVLLFLAHSMVTLEQLSTGIGLDVFGAMLQFQRLAERA